MMTAGIRFLTNNLLADLTCRESELREHLQGIGVLTFPAMITLDNARTLQITLKADDEAGETVLSIVDRNKDTLGMVNRLCRYIYCMNEDHRYDFLEMIEDGKIKSVEQGIYTAQKLREQRNMQLCR